MVKLTCNNSSLELLLLWLMESVRSTIPIFTEFTLTRMSPRPLSRFVSKPAPDARGANIPPSLKLFSLVAVFSGGNWCLTLPMGCAMMEKQDRRRFLQASLTSGTVLAVGGANSSQGDVQLPVPPVTEPNPQIRPGRVRWHADFAAACAAGRGSGKPVLLFHMMGRLDQKFC
jgi:hypothetical protein